MTEIEIAAKGTISALVEKLAAEEFLDPAALRDDLAAGRAVVVAGPGRRPLALGGGTTVKVNANVGTSTDMADLDLEGEKIRVAASLGARMISDCSVGGNLDIARRSLIAASDLPVVTVPMYQATAEAGGPNKVTPEGFLEVLRRQLADGASGVVIHAALDGPLLEILNARIMGLVSRGGQLTARWLGATGRSTPLEGILDDTLALLHDHDATLILGNAARGGCVHDRLDDGHRQEADLGETIAQQANAAGVQVIVEAVGGHVHVADVVSHVETYKSTTC